MAKSIEVITQELRQPFEAHDVKWRVQQSGIANGGKPYMMMIPYIDARAIQRRFDEVVGINGWKDELQRIDGGFLCGISLFLDGEWITKWDGANDTNIESIKGGISGAKKRAASEWGVGQYLYNMKEAVFADCFKVESYSDAVNVIKIKDKYGNLEILVGYEVPTLPQEFLPQTDYTPFLEAINSAKDKEELQTAVMTAYNAAQTNNDQNLESQAINAGEKRKAELIKNRDEAIASEFQAVNKWLDAEIKKFSDHNIASTLNAFADSITELLNAKCKGSRFNSDPLLEKLKSARKSALSKIKK